MSARKVITVDGLAGSGKTTLAKLLAKRLGFVSFSTGAVYRSVALIALREGVNLEDPAAVLGVLSKHTIEVRKIDGEESGVYIDGKLVDAELRETVVSDATSRVSQHGPVRDKLVDLQRQIFPGEDIVVEGRDMGTVIFPEAGLKFFVEVSEDVRIQRRVAQLSAASAGNQPLADKQLKEQMKIEVSERDKRDKTRSIAPTIPAKDAIIIDNSAKTLTEVVENMYDFARKRGFVGKGR